MGDYDSSLPVRGDKIDGAVVDANRTGLLMQGNDGSNYQDIAVNSSGHVLVDIQDASLTVTIGAEFTDDSAFTVATDKVFAMGGVATSDSVDSGDIGAFAMTLARELKTSTDLVSVAGTALSVNAGASDAGTIRVTLANDQAVVSVDDNGGSLTVDATNLDIRDLDYTTDSVEIKDAGGDALAINADGSINTVSTAAVLLDNYGSANLVKNTATTANSYSPSAASDTLSHIDVAGSGLMKVELLFGTTSSETVFAVKYNSTAEPNVPFDLKGKVIASTETIIVRCTNLENAASPASDFDGHATIYYSD